MCATDGKLRLDETSCPTACQGGVLELYPKDALGVLLSSGS